jgi:hypothetical protein
MKKVYFLTFLTILTIFFTSAFAAGIYVYPLVEKVSGKPGDTVSFQLELTNGFPSKVNLQLIPSDFFVNSTGAYDYTAGYGFSAVDWMKIPNTTLTLNPGQSATQTVQINIPLNASGQRFAALNVIYVPPNQTGLVRLTINTVVIVIVNITNSPQIYSTKFGTFTIYNTSSPLLPGNFPQNLKAYPYVMEMNYTNNGNIVVGLNGQIAIVSDTLHRFLGNITVGREDTIAFPSITRKLWIPIEMLLPNGDYRAILTADLGDKNMTSYVFNFKITDAKESALPLFKTGSNEIDVKFERPGVYSNSQIKLESLDYRMINFKTSIVGMKQNSNGTLEEAPLDKSIFGNFKFYPEPLIVYPYSERIGTIAGPLPSKTPKDGQYYALLKVTGALDNGASKTTSIPIVLSVGNLTQSIDATNLKISQYGTGSSVSFTINNTGNAYVDYSGQITVVDSEGNSVLMEPIQINAGRIYAGAAVNYNLYVPVKPETGYKFGVSIQYTAGTDSTGKTIYKSIFIEKGM